MSRLRPRGLFAVEVSSLLLAGVAASCGYNTGTDKLGGQGDVEQLTLTMAHGFGGGGEGSPVPAFTDEVARLTSGTVNFEYTGAWHRGDIDMEARTVEDVQAGTFDMALVGARVFDEIGVDSFQALLAPMLVDSHDLQEAVFEAGVPTEMLAGVDELDSIVGIAVLPGPMRKLLGIEHPFVSPADFEGEVVGVTQSAVADQTMAALGATSLDIGAGEPLVGIDALEQQFDSIVSNSYTEVADYVTANINLWPRPLVIVMNAERFESLSPEQQSALRDAAQGAIPVSLEGARSEDVHGPTIICRTDTALVAASDDDLAAMHTALEPFYTDLAADPVTADYLDQITALKEQVAAPPDSAECEPAASYNSGFPQGRFETPRGPDDVQPDCNEWVVTEHITQFLELDDGVYALTDKNGVLSSPRANYEVFEDHVTFENEFSGRWTFDGTTLTFSQLTAPDGSPIACGADIVWAARPWVVVPADIATDTTSP